MDQANARLGVTARMLPVIGLLCAAYGISLAVIAIKLEASGAAFRMIGLSAAMPAIGWVLGSLAMPAILRRIRLGHFMVVLLAVALVAWLAIPLVQSEGAWLAFRFAFGGAMGLFFRTYEYWLTVAARQDHRGRAFGIYAATFVLGIIIGSLTQPALGVGGAAYGTVAVMIAASGLYVVMTFRDQTALPQRGFAIGAMLRHFRLAPAAMLGAAVFSMYEELVASLLPIYALRIGYGETVAATLLSVAALGALVGGLPLGTVSDRRGRITVLLAISIAAVIMACIMPVVSQLPVGLYASILILSLVVEGIFVISIALLADRFAEEELLHANISYSMFYAAGAVIGPVYLGEMTEALGPQGLFIGAAVAFGAMALASRLRLTK